MLVWLFRMNPVIAALAQISLASLRQYDLWRANLYFLGIGGLVMLIIGSLRISYLVRPK
jgi:hypothetical protein